jgi:hypothetical protein
LGLSPSPWGKMSARACQWVHTIDLANDFGKDDAKIRADHNFRIFLKECNI